MSCTQFHVVFETWQTVNERGLAKTEKLQLYLVTLQFYVVCLHIFPLLNSTDGISGETKQMSSS